MTFSRKQIVVLLSIYFKSSFMAKSAYGDCARPAFDNLEGILVHPEKDTYSLFDKIELNCTLGRVRSALPEFSYCHPDGTWDEYDPTGGSCVKASEPPSTDAVTTDAVITESQREPGMEVWKVVVGVTVPIVGILTITIVGLVCWLYRRLDRTSPVSESTKLKTKPYQEDIGDSDRDASRPGSMMIMNNDGNVQEVVLPCRNDSSEGEFMFAPDIDSKGKNQMLPMVDCPSNCGPSSYDNDPPENIVSSYDNYNCQNHDTRNTTEIDSRYF